MARLDNVNARVGARRSRLIGAEGLRELLVRPSLSARIELLVRSGRMAATVAEVRPVSATLTEGTAGDRRDDAQVLAAVEAALRAKVRADEARLLREVEGPRQRRLLAAAFGLEEARAMKVLLRGTTHGVAPDRLVELVPATERLPEARVRRLAEAASPDALAARLAEEGSPYAEPIRAGLRERDRVGLLAAEVELDRVAFGRVGEAAHRGGEDAEALLEWLAGKADGRNATTLLLLGAASPSRQLFVPGGRRIGAAAFGSLARGGVEARREAAAALVPCTPERLLDPTAAELILQRAEVRRLTRAARRKPLSLAVPLAWIEARRDEVRRIAVVLRGASLALPGDTILETVEA
ncbi:MAG: V-type ATPase subunit [Anaeromyxobacteraceae bacterium]